MSGSIATFGSVRNLVRAPGAAHVMAVMMVRESVVSSGDCVGCGEGDSEVEGGESTSAMAACCEPCGEVDIGAVCGDGADLCASLWLCASMLGLMNVAVSA